jgi:DNA mismatch repair protein MLH3
VASFAGIFGDGLTASSKSFRASAQGVHVRGFLSLAGHPTKAHQYLFVNGHHIAKSELYEVVGEAYMVANVFGREIGDDEESAARGEMALQNSGKKESAKSKSCFPVFVLHLEMPRSDVDHSLEPLKNSVMFKVSGSPVSHLHWGQALIATSVGCYIGSKCSRKRGEECSPIRGGFIAEI